MINEIFINGLKFYRLKPKSKCKLLFIYFLYSIAIIHALAYSCWEINVGFTEMVFQYIVCIQCVPANYVLLLIWYLGPILKTK